MLAELVKWLTPWEFSWPLLLAWLGTAVLYWRGHRRQPQPWPRQLAFWLGMALIYVSLHTYVDFYCEHEFVAHRIQQIVLHHLAPLLLVSAYPASVLRRGLPLRWRSGLNLLTRCWPWRLGVAIFGNPTVASLLFVVFVLVWLIPSVQTLAMLDWRIYRFMNWSMLASGLIYWSLVLDHRPHPPGRMVVGMRVLSPAITMMPQIVVGAVITFARHDLYPIFAICGRAFSFDLLTGQMMGGVMIWVPAAMIEAVGSLLAMRQWLRLSRAGRIRQRPRPGAVVATSVVTAGAASDH
ncbi:cytochrome c oxidase assembly protein [Frateuria aurantia]|uniref:Putative membrane protein n=1 Tax=Frateuria aurantia (strain ATCC 33424 / DSM 6220 / KCTC 2777 / LMG 1558 / NBRC 3245 / NCIMB 13370) TaxID=767434 RepID=H8KZZ8_FRAAD|nr:cytochrome c oxidase assembly protein [Frateuria aurantia]AFC85279.1 putative membrane protein [Frateuria aurantia DSM 6220]